MGGAILKALFVFTGLLLLRCLGALLPHARRMWQRAVIHALMGLGALTAFNTVGGLFGVGLGLNALTLPVSAGLGVPGVALLWALRYLL